MSSDLKRGDIVEVTVRARVVNVGYERVEVYYDNESPKFPLIEDVRLVQRELKIGDRVHCKTRNSTWIWLGSQWMLIECPLKNLPLGYLQPRSGITFDSAPSLWTYIPVGEVEDE